MKRVLLDLLRRDQVFRCLRPFRPSGATILCFHRFADPGAGNPGHPAAELRANLAFLRRHRFHPVGLAELIATLESGTEPRRGTVVLTIDDGYADVATVAAPILAEFDCPATVFLVTGFVDGSLWLWWDRIEYMFRETARRTIALTVEGRAFEAEWDTPAEGELEAQRLAELLEPASDEARRQAMTDLEELLDIVPPAIAPERYAAMTWDDVRRCERRGITFGPHSVSHPILSRVGDEMARSEIAGSWEQVCARTEAPVPVFCYPNGSPFTFDAREMRIIRESGLRAAVTTAHGYATARGMTATADARFLIPRFPYYDDLPHFAKVLSGTERLKSVLRTVSVPGRSSA